MPTTKREHEESRSDAGSRPAYDQLKGLFDESLVPVIFRDLDGVVWMANKMCWEQLGLTKDQFISKTAAEVFPAETAERYDKTLRDVITSGSAVQQEETADFGDGTVHTYLLTQFPTRNAQGEIDGTCAVTQEITEMKALEESLRVQVLRANNAVSGLDSFAQTVSHDLRSPLRAVNGFVALLERQLGDAATGETKQLLDKIGDGVAEMGTLIDRLLAFSRDANLAIERQQVDTNDIVSQVVTTLIASSDQQTPEVSVEGMPPCEADPNLLRLVFQNLISNAMKYSTNEQHPQITVGWVADADDPGGNYFVRDNGVGFDPEYADKLFNAFERLHSVDEFEGVGVGLATVQRIIERHGGKIWAESTVGEGATFYFTLPAATAN